MCIGHCIGSAHDARQRRYVADLLVDLVVHGLEPLAITVDQTRNAHAAVRLDTPRELALLLQTGNIHECLYVDDTLGAPAPIWHLLELQRRKSCSLDLDNRLVGKTIDGLPADPRIEPMIVKHDAPFRE